MPTVRVDALLASQNLNLLEHLLKLRIHTLLEKVFDSYQALLESRD
jgi:hypothetical protein